MRVRFTLTELFWLMLISVSAALALYFSILLEASGRSIMRSAASLAVGAAQRAGRIVEDYLYGAERTVLDVGREIDIGACDASSPEAIQPCLVARLLADSNVTGVALTHGNRIGYANDGEIELAPGDRWQVSAFRKQMGAGSPICVRTTRGKDRSFIAHLECRAASARLNEQPETSEWASARDPTLHPTFTTPASRQFEGRTLWSDLSYSDLDAALPERERRVVVNVLRGMNDPDGRFIGVARVALSSETLAADVRGIHVNERDAHDPYRVFLCDDSGRLVTAIARGDRVQAFGEDLRVPPSHVPDEIAQAVRQPSLVKIDEGASFASGEFDLRGAGSSSAFGRSRTRRAGASVWWGPRTIICVVCEACARG